MTRFLSLGLQVFTNMAAGTILIFWFIEVSAETFFESWTVK